MAHLLGSKRTPQQVNGLFVADNIPTLLRRVLSFKHRHMVAELLVKGNSPLMLYRGRCKIFRFPLIMVPYPVHADAPV